MLKTRAILTSLMLILLAFSTSFAQDEAAKASSKSSRPITAVTVYASADRVRFTAPSSVVQMRLEVYNSTGKKVFDNELRGGNILDWHLQDGQADRLADDAYLCVVTVKGLSGRITERIGSVVLEKGSASLQPADVARLTAAQSQAIGPLEEDASLSIVREDEPQIGTVMAHNGEEGQIVRGRGDLSFRLGDFLRGRDTEQMRLTAEGNVGIGISHPQVRLEVDGLIRTTRGIVFPDGSVQTTAALIGNPGQTPTINLPGQSEDQAKTTGKTGKHKKVGPEFNANEDLTINGNIIFTPPSVGSTRDITMQNNSGGLRFFGAPTLTSSPAAAAIQFWGNSSPFPGQLYLDAGAINSGAVIIRTTGTGGTIAERMRVTAAGNVGIGTNNPGSLLDVAGNINTSTQYNILGERVLSIPGSQNIFVGVGAGASNTSGTVNAFFGSLAGNANTTGVANAFFGAAAGQNSTTGNNNAFFGGFAGFFNTTGFQNSFFGALAGQSSTTGNSNAFFGTSAGTQNTTGSNNASFGNFAGFSNTTGVFNSFFGNLAGQTNTTEDNNNFFGAFSEGAVGITNATAIGTNAQVAQSNSLVLGSINGINGAIADTSVGIGTAAPKARLHVQGGNIYISAPGQGIILKSPDGNTCRLLSINNTGAIVASIVTCP